MSFDVFLHHFQDRSTAPANKQAVRSVVAQHGDVLPDKHGQYEVPLCDDTCIRLSASELDLESESVFSSCAFHLRDFSEVYCDFILEIAIAGDFVIFNAQGRDTPQNPVLILSTPSQIDHVPTGMYKHSIVAESGAHLFALLEGTFDAWEEYRARAISLARPSTNMS